MRQMVIPAQEIVLPVGTRHFAESYVVVPAGWEDSLNPAGQGNGKKAGASVVERLLKPLHGR